LRQAVTSYRQPSLAAELVSSRRMLASAGIECRLRVPGAYSLPPAVDGLLAWTVREGATNILRHAAARHAEIVVELASTEASACLSDDGAGPGRDALAAIAAAVPAAGGATAAGGGGPAGAADAGAGGAPAGSGLAGLAERAARLGGTLSAGAGEGGGFRLRVSVPLTVPPAAGPPEGAAAGGLDPGRERMPS
jgi:two-component system sensor histidine kinase DesK